MRRSAPRLAVSALLIGAVLWVFGQASAQTEVPVRAAVLRIEVERPLPLSRLDLPADDGGFAGARVATTDNNTTGRFLGHVYETREETATPETAGETFDALVADGVGYVVVLAPADTLLALEDRAAGRDVVLFNAAAPDDRLRNDDCRANVFHTAPSRAMLADGLAQYLVWKKWTGWLLIHGSHPEDQAKAEAYRRAAARFGAEITGELVFEDRGGARVSDSGHVLAQRQIPVLTQRAPEHDVVVVADESEVFGAYIPYRTWEPRPVAGDAGLVARSWAWSWEGYGSTQVQRRFEKAAGRFMGDIDYQVWLALRSVGEAVTRTNSAEVATVRDYMVSDAFELSGFKGVALSYRPWNNQLRHGVLLADGRLVVSVSPQEEFLHQTTRLDTLGYDRPDSTCSF
jgi:ABC transporter substrate binding protein (PQQ-dependent alcohol dehydrogenase system)